MLVGVTWWRSMTTDHFLGRVLALGKLVSIVLFALSARAPCILYTMLSLLFWLVLKQPKLQDPALPDIQSLEDFEDSIDSLDSRGLTFLVFYANWNDRCTYVSEQANCV